MIKTIEKTLMNNVHKRSNSPCQNLDDFATSENFIYSQTQRMGSIKLLIMLLESFVKRHMDSNAEEKWLEAA